MKSTRLGAALIVLAATPAFSQTAPVELWGGLKSGMSAEEVAVILRSRAGIKAVQVKRDKQGRDSLNIKYDGRGLDIAGKPSRVAPMFADGRLSAVRISPVTGFGLAFCLSNGQTAFGYYHALLANKYKQNFEPNTNFDDVFVARLRLDRVNKKYYTPPVADISEGFTDGSVQVFNAVRLRAATDTSDQQYSFNVEYAVCKNDVGLYATPSLLYMSKADADAVLQGSQQQREQAMKSLSDQL
jgi:hypothetical protein